MEAYLNPSVDFSTKRAEQIAAEISSEYMNQSANTDASYIDLLNAAVNHFSERLGTSSIDIKQLDHRERPDVVKWNVLFKNLEKDLDYLYNIYEQLSTSEIEVFNRHTSLYEGLRNFISNTGLLTVDTSMASGLNQHAVFVVGDGFTTTNNIDAVSTAEPAFGASGITLEHINSERIADSNTEIDVVYSDTSYADANGRFVLFEPYEGMLFAEQGLARPEGTKFKFKKTLPPGARNKSGEIQKTKVVTRSGGLANAIGREFNRVANKVGGALGLDATTSSILTGVLAGAFTGGLGVWGIGLGYLANKNRRKDTGEKAYIPDTQIYLAEPSESELRAKRRLMLDDQADTFWEIERCVQIGVKDEEELLEPSLPEESLRKAREFREEFPNYNLDFIMKVKFKKETNINWVNIDPVRFHPSADINIVNIKYKDANGEFKRIPNFNRFASYLTDSANSSLGESISSRLGVNGYKFGGQGLWAFPMINTDELHIDVNVETPYVSPYDLYAFQLVRKTTIKKSGASVGGIKLGSDKKEEITETQTVRLPYVEGLSIFEGYTDLEEAADTTESETDVKEGVNINVAGLSLFSSGGKSISSTGWKVSESWQETRTDIFRFGAGIKELGVYNISYAQKSELVSTTYKLPVPAVSATLEVDTTIPDGYGPFNWLQYYISVDDGASWVGIAPKAQDITYDRQGNRVNKLVRFVGRAPDEDAVDPRITYVVTDNPVKSVKFRAVLNRPSNDNTASPVLNSYSIVLATNETLRELV